MRKECWTVSLVGQFPTEYNLPTTIYLLPDLRTSIAFGSVDANKSSSDQIQAMAESVATDMKQFTAVTNEFASYLLHLIQDLKTNNELECFSHDIMKICQQHQRNRLKV